MKLRGKAKARARRQARTSQGSARPRVLESLEEAELGDLSPDDWNRYRRWLGEAETGEPLPPATCLRVYRETSHDPSGPSDYRRRSTLHAHDALEWLVNSALYLYREVPEVAALLDWEDEQGRCPCRRCAPEVLP